ncbi:MULTISPECIES: hypothetical protein [Actinosynnema]|uniref:hypothetical protein n=1 Tax=Actinosynnema TaxID=40566 RepID=UPI0020A4F57B|nr:hypothetical protein [Actinosynnema pretiosum]MCP2093318.1 hypothetical protein [Actinosynnema pretiosum]
MDRRRIGFVAAGAVLFAGVVVVLRGGGLPGPADAGISTRPPPPTSLTAFSSDGVLVPAPGPAPDAPEELAARPGPGSLLVTWTGGAPGYEVRWGLGDVSRTRLVTGSLVELRVPDGREQRVEVRAVDEFGQRSAPASASGVPGPVGVREPGAYHLVDRFERADAPDPARWRLTTKPGCARVGAGEGEEAAALVVATTCAGVPAVLRSRAPLVLREDAEELGRFAVGAGGPIANGELALELAPGPVAALSGAGLPPGALRLVVRASEESVTAQVLTAEGDRTRVLRPLDDVEPGTGHVWELVLRRDGALVLLDGEPVVSSPVVPAWREATALVSLSGPIGQRVPVWLAGLGGAPSAPPPLVGPVRVEVTPEGGEAGAGSGAPAGQLRMTLSHARPRPPTEPLVAVVSGVPVPLRAAVDGAPFRVDTGFPVVGDVPAGVASVSDDGVVGVRLALGFEATATHAELEFEPGGPVPAATGLEPGPPETALPRPTARVLDASGAPLPSGAPVPRGRVVVELVLVGAPAQHGLAGLAGFGLWMDGTRIASVPTALGGPAVAGSYRVAVNTGSLPGGPLAEGPHMVEARLFGTSGSTRPTSAFASFFAAR